MTRRVAIVTSGRQDYGLLVPLLNAIRADPALELLLIVAGMHLDEAHGLTVRDIEADGFPIAAHVDAAEVGDDEIAAARSTARALARFAEELVRLAPELLVLLGDRVETLAAATAATLCRVPIAHLHGGEATEGAVDDAFRHAITKMAYLHFPAAEPYRDRIIQMGEDPARVYCVGALAVDRISELALPSRVELETNLGISFEPPFFVVTFHPATLDDDSPRQFSELLAALDESQSRCLFTRPNNDAGSKQHGMMLDAFVSARPGRACAVATLGQRRYFGAVRQATAVVGNSSSGIIEAPYLATPTVNIGDRQRGRLAAPSVISVPAERNAISHALRQVAEPDFRAAAESQPNPYGDGRAARQIVDVLRSADLTLHALKKRFHSLPA
jgi:UDP-hydrolysing UDP-N-acetyl-D-glucosamine 2-epimerase